jgi:pimeloyl-ACP methyl ester carboxylesterase
VHRVWPIANPQGRADDPDEHDSRLRQIEAGRTGGAMRSLAAGPAQLLVLAGCSGADGVDRAGASSPSATTSQASPGELDGVFDVGAYGLYLSCHGTGEPTVLYLHGLGGDGGDVDEAIRPRLTDRVRVCSYDRVNVGRSEAQPGRHTGADSVRDLHALLTAADVRGPYLLLGFSFGGLLAAMYAGTYPDEVTGLLMLDSSLPTDDEVDAMIPADERAQVKADQEANQERVDFYRTLDQAERTVRSIPDVPVTYMAAVPVDLPGTWPVGRMRRFIRAQQAQFVDRFRQGRLVAVTSSHDIDLDRPDLVIAEVERILGRS